MNSLKTKLPSSTLFYWPKKQFIFFQDKAPIHKNVLAMGKLRICSRKIHHIPQIWSHELPSFLKTQTFLIYCETNKRFRLQTGTLQHFRQNTTVTG